jgi:2,3-bisphosphoglycerate-independent phosphoglycerate mutase
MASNVHYDTIPGATGYIDTNYQAKADYTIRYLEKYDFVLTHINATDEEAHQHNHEGKMRAIENVDHMIVGPVLRELVKEYAGNFRIAVCGDHQTRCCDGKHTDVPVPFALFGAGVAPSNTPVFCESICNAYEPVAALHFLERYLFS